MKIEVTRVELPVKEGHRGRKPCEWRIGDFVIPKSLTCMECERPKATNKDAFVKLLEKSQLKPEKLVKKYICRSCRASMRANDEPVKIGKADESKVESESMEVIDEAKRVTGLETKKRGFFLGGIEIGMIVKRKPVIFYTNTATLEGRGISREQGMQATEIYVLSSHECLKHPAHPNLHPYQIRAGMAKFADVKTMFALEDMDEVLKTMV